MYDISAVHIISKPGCHVYCIYCGFMWFSLRFLASIMQSICNRILSIWVRYWFFDVMQVSSKQVISKGYALCNVIIVTFIISINCSFGVNNFTFLDVREYFSNICLYDVYNSVRCVLFNISGQYWIAFLGVGLTS